MPLSLLHVFSSITVLFLTVSESLDIGGEGITSIACVETDELLLTRSPDFVDCERGPIFGPYIE